MISLLPSYLQSQINEISLYCPLSHNTLLRAFLFGLNTKTLQWSSMFCFVSASVQYRPHILTFYMSSINIKP